MTIAILVLISITVITLDQRAGTHHLTSGFKSAANDAWSPVRGGVDDIVHPVGDFFAGMVNYGSLQEENNKLRASIGQLREQDAEGVAAKQQLGQLTRLEHLTYLGNLKSVTATVVASSTSNFASTIQIDLGRGDGVDVGMPVVGYGGLVGTVTQASHHTATVTLVDDGSSKVGCTFTNGAAATTWASVQGQGSGQSLLADFVQPSTNVTVGEQLATSQAQGGLFPTGIPVGTVSSVHRISGSTQLTIHVKASADLSNLTYVDVVLWTPPA